MHHGGYGSDTQVCLYVAVIANDEHGILYSTVVHYYF